MIFSILSSLWQKSRELMRSSIARGPRRRDEAVLAEIRASLDDAGPGARMQAATARLLPETAVGAFGPFGPARIFARKLGIAKRPALLLALCAGAIPIMSGCQTQFSQRLQQRLSSRLQLQQRMPGPEPLAPAPSDNDPAFAYRNWQPASALYKSDMVISGPTYKVLEPKAGDPGQSIIREPVLFLANILYMPVSMVEDFPANGVRYKSLSTPPTYTDMPPLVRIPAEGGEPIQTAAPTVVPTVVPTTQPAPTTNSATTTLPTEPSTIPDTSTTRPSDVLSNPIILNGN